MTLLEVLRAEYEELHGGGSGLPPPGDTFDRLYRQIHELDPPRAALCLSGGGIRSASFALGVLQALARRGLLPQFHYLSTVSGGGYVGAFLSAWRWHEADDERVFSALVRRDRDAGFAEPRELEELRANSNFLTPRLGLLSADTWTAIVLYLRNLLLNWFIFAPLFLGLLLIPHASWDALIWFNNLVGIVNWAMLLVALLLLLLGLAVSVAGRPARDRPGAGGFSERRFAPKTRSIILFICLPIFGAAGFLAIFSAWLPPNRHDLLWGVLRLGEPGPDFSYPIFRFYPILYPALVGALVYALAWVIGFFAGGGRPRELRRIRKRRRDPVPPLAELGCYAVSGAAAGAIVTIGIAFYQRLSGLAEGGDASALLAFFFGGYNRISIIVAVGVAWTMVAVFAADLLFTGLTSYHRNGDADREWSARLAGYLAAGAILWLAFAAIVLYGPFALAAFNGWAFTMVGGASGLATLLLGGSGKTAATTARQVGERLSVTTVVDIATLVFILVLAILLSRLARSGLEYAVPALGIDASSLAKMILSAGAAAALIVFSAIASYWINVNRFSLHAVYRNRLIRAFLGAARAGHREETRTHSSPDPFTGFAEADNLPLAALWERGGNGGRRCLYPVVNTTLNVVASANLAWQERKAEPFAMTPLACGNPIVEFVPTQFYGGPRRGITLGTAMAISGAAVSPNQGYHSSPIVGLLLTLFNVRLGWWLGNPRKGPQFYRRAGPRLSIWPVLDELFGRTHDQGPYVYLSDGGHFENLGLYEMVQRRCRFILISDAGSDPKCTLEDLGNAVRKIWIDLGIGVEFERIDVAARREPPADGVYCALGRIRYPEDGAKEGILVYVKPGFHGSEPPDIRSYAALHQAFPHEGTGDQWFSESQMESYRGLGSHILETMCDTGGEEEPDAPLSLAELIDRIRHYLERTRPRPP
jgi:hypothetical protein